MSIVDKMENTKSVLQISEIPTQKKIWNNYTNPLFTKMDIMWFTPHFIIRKSRYYENFKNCHNKMIVYSQIIGRKYSI